MSEAKSVVIIGGSRGIGLGIVKQVLSAYPQATVFATARNPDKATELQALSDSNKGRIQTVALDADDSKSIQQAASKIGEQSESVDVVIYNSGVLLGFGNLLDAGAQPLIDNMTTNVYGAYYVAAAFAPLLLKSKYERKSLVFLSSSFASMQLVDEITASHEVAFGAGFDATALYNTALNRLGKELDTVLAPQGLPVLLVHPGLVKTDMNAYGDIEVPESATGVVKVIQTFTPGKKNFYSWTGEALPW
ncbi:NAD(P)-binding protein [Trichoderma evansii]